MPDVYAEMFELAPVSLWLEDYSGLKPLFARWRAEGVTDLRSWLRADPTRVAECAQCIQLLQVNRRTLSLFGASSFEHLKANLHEVFRDDMLDQHVEELAQLWDGELQFSSRTVNYSLDGRRLAITLQATVLPGHEHDWSRVLIAIDDVTEQARTERALRASEGHARGLFEHSPVSLWVEDFSSIRRLLDEVRAKGIDDFRVFLDVHPEFVDRCMREIRVLDVNRQTLTMFQAPDKHSLLNQLDTVFRGEMRANFTEQLVDLWEGRTTHQREVVNYALNGDKLHVYLQFSVLPGHEARWDQVLISLTDITARRKAEAYLEYLGRHDVLTGLANRAYFIEELQRLERRGPWPVTVVMVDLNGLKAANDRGGHAAGDALLRRTGEVLGKVVEGSMSASRIGGDEFALLLPGVDERGGQRVMEQLRDLLALNNQYHASAPLHLSLGMATGQHGARLEAVIHEADQAMYESKRSFYARRERDRRSGFSSLD